MGWNAAHDETEHPSDEQVREEIVQCVIDQLHIYFAFEEL